MSECRIIAVIKNAAGTSVKTEKTVDGERTVTEYLITDEAWKALKCDEGDILSEKEEDFLVGEADFCRAAARALKILSYSAHSKNFLVRKLVKFGFSEEVARRAADATEAKGFLSESRQAGQICDYCIRHKYWGKKRIAAELMSKGYSKETIIAAIGEIPEESFADNLRRLVERKPVPSDKGDRDKYISSLSRLGYSLTEILNAIKEAEDK